MDQGPCITTENLGIDEPNAYELFRLTGMSRDSEGVRAGRPGFEFQQGKDIFLFSTSSSPVLGRT
jgi:hypothetical protein